MTVYEQTTLEKDLRPLAYNKTKQANDNQH